MPLSDRQIAGAAAAAGFQGRALVTAVAVALAESGGNPHATHRNTNGSTDYGLWQINSIHADLLKQGQWSNPDDNARMAFRVWRDAGGSFRPWVTYTTGRHLAYVGRAKRAAATPHATEGGAATPGGAQALPAGLPLAHGIGVLTSGNTWIRVGMFLAGGALLIWTLVTAVGEDALRLTPMGKVIR